jgi:hypothetical protein
VTFELSPSHSCNPTVSFLAISAAYVMNTLILAETEIFENEFLVYRLSVYGGFSQLECNGTEF